MPRGILRRLTQAEKRRMQRENRAQGDPMMTQGKLDDKTEGELYRGHMDELVRDPGQGSLTVWMAAWRCKRCGHCWPIRRRRRTKGEGGRYLEAKALGVKVGAQPKKCPGCDSPLWWKDYTYKLDSPQRRGRLRRPRMLRQVREGETQVE
jgi:hypothetical protein